MKRYTLSGAASSEHKPDQPERTARRSLSWDVEYQVWPSRAAMLTTVHMQERRAPSRLDWRPIIAEWAEGSPERISAIAEQEG